MTSAPSPKVVSTAVLGTTGVPPELLRRCVEIDIVTDQTSTNDPLAHRRMGVSAQDRPLAQGSHL